MAKKTTKIFKKVYSRLKKIFEKILSPKKNNQQTQLILQPIRTKKYFEG